MVCVAQPTRSVVASSSSTPFLGKGLQMHAVRGRGVKGASKGVSDARSIIYEYIV